MPFAVVYKHGLERKVRTLPPKVKRGIKKKIDWLAENVFEIKHAPIIGSDFFSLHYGQYRIAYDIGWTNQVITIVEIDKHDDTYDRINR
jgi:mRNA-degrading endonuclease RelE of RelBE toxin-antitoxin system